MPVWREASHVSLAIMFKDPYVSKTLTLCISKNMFSHHVFSSLVYRQGDIGTSWYAVLFGSLDVKVSETANHQVYWEGVMVEFKPDGALPPPAGLGYGGDWN